MMKCDNCPFIDECYISSEHCGVSMSICPLAKLLPDIDLCPDEK